MAALVNRDKDKDKNKDTRHMSADQPRVAFNTSKTLDKLINTCKSFYFRLLGLNTSSISLNEFYIAAYILNEAQYRTCDDYELVKLICTRESVGDILNGVSPYQNTEDPFGRILWLLTNIFCPDESKVICNLREIYYNFVTYKKGDPISDRDRTTYFGFLAKSVPIPSGSVGLLKVIATIDLLDVKFIILCLSIGIANAVSYSHHSRWSSNRFLELIIKDSDVCTLIGSKKSMESIAKGIRKAKNNDDFKRLESEDNRMIRGIIRSGSRASTTDRTVSCGGGETDQSQPEDASVMISLEPTTKNNEAISPSERDSFQFHQEPTRTFMDNTLISQDTGNSQKSSESEKLSLPSTSAVAFPNNQSASSEPPEKVSPKTTTPGFMQSYMQVSQSQHNTTDESHLLPNPPISSGFMDPVLPTQFLREKNTGSDNLQFPPLPAGFGVTKESEEKRKHIESILGNMPTNGNDLDDVQVLSSNPYEESGAVGGESPFSKDDQYVKTLEKNQLVESYCFPGQFNKISQYDPANLTHLVYHSQFPFESTVNLVHRSVLWSAIQDIGNRDLITQLPCRTEKMSMAILERALNRYLLDRIQSSGNIENTRISKKIDKATTDTTDNTEITQLLASNKTVLEKVDKLSEAVLRVVHTKVSSGETRLNKVIDLVKEPQAEEVPKNKKKGDVGALRALGLIS